MLASEMVERIRGRVVDLSATTVTVRTQHAGHVFPRNEAHRELAIGDIVVSNERGTLRVLTRGNGSLRRCQQILDPRRQKGTRIRHMAELAVHTFFVERGFQHTRTPLLVENPGMEPHISPLRVGQAYLPTSPEFALKELLVGGLEQIYELTPAFRHEPQSRTHLPEFTMLEWYRAYADLDAIMQDVEALVCHVSSTCHGSPVFPFQDHVISVAPPWPRKTVRELFREHANIDLADPNARAAREESFAQIWLDHVEPRLPKDRPLFVTDYPSSQAALANVRTDATGSWAQRFEVFIGGFELANAFDELTDVREQTRRFEQDMSLRHMHYGAELPATALPTIFLDALAEGLPPSSGIALGFDRLVMLMANEPDIQFTSWLTPYAP